MICDDTISCNDLYHRCNYVICVTFVCYKASYRNVGICASKRVIVADFDKSKVCVVISDDYAVPLRKGQCRFKRQEKKSDVAEMTMLIWTELGMKELEGQRRWEKCPGKCRNVG